MNTEELNIKLTVDTTKSEQSTVNYKAKIKELRDEMVALAVETNGLADATDEQREKYAALEQEAANLTDILGDVQQRIKTSADDYSSFNAAMEGGKGIIAFGQGIAGVTNLLGMNSDAVNRGIQVMMSLQSVMSAVNTVQQIFNKDSKVMIAMEKLKVAALGEDKAATVGATAATTAFATGEGVATTASFTLAGACKAVGVAIKSIPVIGWILAAVAALITLISLIASCNKEADMGDKIAADILEKDKERKQALDDISRKHKKIADNLKEELDAIQGMDEEERQYKDTITEAAKILNISYEAANELHKEDAEALQEKIDLVKDYDKNLEQITENEEKQNQARKDREALETRIQEIMAEGYETSQASLDKLVEEGKITEDQQALLQKYRNQRARSEMSLYNAQQSALVVVNKQLGNYQAIEDSCAKQLTTLKNTTKEQKKQINNLQTEADLSDKKRKKDDETEKEREAAWKKFKSDRDSAQKSYIQSVEDMAIADAEYDKDYDRLLEERKKKVNRLYDEDKKKYDDQLKKKLITQEQYNTLVAASTEKLNNDIAKLEADNQKRIDDEKEKAEKERKEKEAKAKEDAEKAAQDEKERQRRAIDAQNNIDDAVLATRLANLKEGSEEYFELQQEIENERYDQEMEELRRQLEDKQITQDEFDAIALQKEAEHQRNITAIQEEEDNKRIELTQNRLSTVGNILSNMSNFVSSLMETELEEAEGNEKKQKEIKKKYATAQAVMKIGQIGIDTALGIMGVWSQVMELGPIAGPILGAILSATIGALGIANTAKAMQEKNKIMKAARGAYIVGPSHSQGGVTMEVEGGEAVLNKKAMAIPQYRALASAMNVSTGGVAFPNTNSNAAFTAQVDDTVIDKIVNKIAAIPVVVSESDISKTVRKVDTIEGRSRI